MGDVDQRNALFFQHAHHFKQFVHFLHSQRGGGFVQNNDLGVVGDCLGDLAHLPLGNRHIAHGLGQVDRHAQFAEQVGCRLFHQAFVHHAHGIDRISTQEQVVDHAAFQALVQFLVHHGDAVFQGVFGAGEVDLLAVEEDFSFVFLVGAKKTFHHRGLTGAVFAHKTHDGAALYVQIDMIKYSVAAKRLAHTAN